MLFVFVYIYIYIYIQHINVLTLFVCAYMCVYMYIFLIIYNRILSKMLHIFLNNIEMSLGMKWLAHYWRSELIFGWNSRNVIKTLTFMFVLVSCLVTLLD